MLPLDEIEIISKELLDIREVVPGLKSITRSIYTNEQAYKLAIVAYKYKHPDFNDEVLA